MIAKIAVPIINLVVRHWEPIVGLFRTPSFRLEAQQRPKQLIVGDLRGTEIGTVVSTAGTASIAVAGESRAPVPSNVTQPFDALVIAVTNAGRGRALHAFGTITVYDSGGRRLFEITDAHWEGTPFANERGERASSTQHIEPRATARLDVLLKYQHEAGVYGVSLDSQCAGWRVPDYLILEPQCRVVVDVRCQNRWVVWRCSLDVINLGVGQGINFDNFSTGAAPYRWA